MQGGIARAPVRSAAERLGKDEMNGRTKTRGSVLIWLCLLVAAGMVAASVFALSGTGRASGFSLAEETEESSQKIQIWTEEKESPAIVIRQDTEGEAEEKGEEGENLEAAEEIHLAFGGDVYLSDHVLKAYQQGGIGGVLGESLRRQAEAADLFMVNEEFPFSLRGEPAPDKQYTFRLPPDKVSLFQEMGIDLVTLANNHGLDYGREALLDSLETLDGAGIAWVGAGENLDQAKAMKTFEIKGKTLGFLGATRVIPVADWAASSSRPGMLSAYDPSLLLEEIRKGKENCDFLVVYLHWGLEQKEMPEEYQRQMGRQCIEAGADLVIGSHPHVLQGLEYYQGKPIVYSLGNYVFGSSIPRTVLLTAVLGEEGLSLQVIPATSSAGYTREITEESRRQELFSYLESISFGVEVDEEGRISPS